VNKSIVMVRYQDRKTPGEFSKREYAYFSKVPLTVGENIMAPVENGKVVARVSQINVEESKIDERIMPKLRTIEELVRPEDAAERKIHSSYAFTENEREKMAENYETHKALKEKYRVFRHDLKMILIDGEDCNFSDYDVVIGRKAGYAHALYRIYKNAPNLSTLELALLCDSGNLCFGYMMEGSDIRVSED